MDADRYAHEQAVSSRDDWQFSRLFSSESARPGFTALLALRVELQQVQANATEPGIAAMKFEWWRTEIERAFSGNAQHPLARALGEHLSIAGSAPEYCHELVDAAETEIETGHAFSEQDFRLYLYRSGGVLAEQLVMLSGLQDRKSLNAARRLGELKRFSDLLRSLASMVRARRWLFPQDWLDQHELDLQDLAHVDPKSRGLLPNMLAVLDQERISARTAMTECTLPPALALQWPLLQHDHARLRDRPERMLDASVHRTEHLKRLWVAWRGARSAAKSNGQG